MNFCSVGKQCITIVLPFYERFGLMISKHQTINGFMRKKGKKFTSIKLYLFKDKLGCDGNFFQFACQTTIEQ